MKKLLLIFVSVLLAYFIVISIPFFVTLKSFRHIGSFGTYISGAFRNPLAVYNTFKLRNSPIPDQSSLNQKFSSSISQEKEGATMNSIIKSFGESEGLLGEKLPWNYSVDPIKSKVFGVDRDKSLIALRVHDPKVLDKIVVSIACGIEESAVGYASFESGGAFSKLEYNVDLWDHISIGDALYGFCLEKECLSLGRSCLLVKGSGN